MLRLAFMYGPGGLSLRSLAASASADGVCEGTGRGVAQAAQRRFGGGLSALCADVLASGREAGETGVPHSATRPIRIVDASRLEGPGGRETCGFWDCSEWQEKGEGEFVTLQPSVDGRNFGY